MSKKEEKITILRLILLCVHYHILSAAEAEVAINTGRLPDTILQKLRIAELKSELKNKN